MKLTPSLQKQKDRYEHFDKSYTEDFILGCLDDLQINDDVSRKEMGEAILNCGKQYIIWRNISDGYRPERELKSKLKKIIRPTKKLKENLNDFLEDNPWDYSHIHNAAIKLRPHFNGKNKPTEKLLDGFVDSRDHDFRDYLTALLDFVDFFEAALMLAEKEVVPSNNIKGVKAVEDWLKKIKPFWHKYSPIEFIAGTHYPKPVGYNSDAVIILSKLMRQMDSEVEKTTIGNTLDRINKEDRKKF